jgi:DNA-binding CsgD family transcriptional regulator
MQAGGPFGLVGRARELASVDAFLDSVGRGAVLVVEGDVGIGKSALLGAAGFAAAQRGYRVVSTEPGPCDAGLSFSGLDDLLGEAVVDVGPMLPVPQRRALQVALLQADDEGEPPSPLAVALAVRGALLAMSEAAPVLVIVDDAQWLDAPTAAAVSHAARRLVDTRVAVAVAVRRGAHDEGDPIVLQDVPPERIVHVDPGPLSLDEDGTLLRETLGVSLPREQLLRLHRACEGNPLFTLEVGRMLPAGGGLGPGDPLPIPPDLRTLARERLSRVRPESLPSLLLIASASEASLPAVTAGPAADALDDAVDAGVLTRVERGTRFAHALYGSVVYADATPEERRAAHRLLADLVEDPEERAAHLAVAADGPDPDVAAALEEAARVGRRRGAPASAAELAESSRRMTPAGEQADEARRALLAAECHLDAGQFDRARGLLEELLETTDGGPVRASALQRLGWVQFHQDTWLAATDLYTQATREAGDEFALVASIELDACVAKLLSGDVPGAESAAGRALEHARKLDDPAFTAEAAAMAMSVDFLLGKGIDEEALTSSVERETWSRPRPTMQHPSVAFGVLLKWAGEFDRAREFLQAARDHAEQRGTERSLPFIHFHLAELEYWAGNLEVAEREVHAATTVAERTGQRTGQAFALAAAVLVAVARGREDEARETAARGLPLAHDAGAVPASMMIESALGSLELSLGNPGHAHRHLAPLVGPLQSVGIYEPGAIRFVGDAIESLIGVGDVELATRITDELSSRSEELDRVWGIVVAGRCRALLRSASGDASGAQADLEAAMKELENLPQPLERGRTLLALGVVRRRDRQKASARDALEQARAIFEELGADLWAERARSELGRIGGRAPSSVDLTPTEERIARMVAEGATNQEVAAALFLAVKTVEWNLTRIYGKLGIRHRTELARWVGPDPDAAG